jgi:hypothetical protein
MVATVAPLGFFVVLFFIVLILVGDGTEDAVDGHLQHSAMRLIAAFASSSSTKSAIAPRRPAKQFGQTCMEAISIHSDSSMHTRHLQIWHSLE